MNREIVMEPMTYKLQNFPDLPLLKIFSYLNVGDKLNCSAVCKNWHRLIYSPSLWKSMKVTDWAYLNDPKFERTLDYHCHHTLQLIDNYKRLWILIGEGYVRMTGNISEIETCVSNDLPLYKQVLNEYRVLIGCLENILPKVGTGVVSLFVDGNGGISDYILNLYLMLCPNVEKLDVHYTSISSMAFKDLQLYGAAQRITHLNLMGCELITDTAILNLTQCWEQGLDHIKLTDCTFEIAVPYCVKPVSEICAELVTVENYWFEDSVEGTHMGRDRVKTFSFPGSSNTVKCGLKWLNLAGCIKLTDLSLEYLAKSPRITDVEFIDVSGCSGFTSNGLKTLVSACPKLQPRHLFYCNMICDGPFSEEANGCQIDDELCCCMISYSY